jgi:hypothetical protein
MKNTGILSDDITSRLAVQKIALTANTQLLPDNDDN